MPDFELRRSDAGQDIFEMGIIKGTFKGALKEARKSVIDILAARFENVPSEIEESVKDRFNASLRTPCQIDASDLQLVEWVEFSSFGTKHAGAIRF